MAASCFNALRLLSFILSVLLTGLGPVAVTALNPDCAPGGNFDLSIWDLQLPFGNTNDPVQIPNWQLENCGGYQDPGHHYFFTESGDGALVMKVLGDPATTGCVTEPHSHYCRTELSEIANWDPNASTNRLTATLAVQAGGTVIGQIHQAAIKPVAELYYGTGGELVVMVQHTRDGSPGTGPAKTPLGSVPLGQQFTYELAYEGGVLTVAIDWDTPTVLDTFALDSPVSYFKVGNYDQGGSPTDVHFFSIAVEH